MSYDHRGMCDGHEYEEFLITHVIIKEYKLSAIEDLDNDSLQASIICEMEIQTLNSYNDYENSPWDPEDEEYVYVEEGKVWEQHDT
ncbi:MAG: hypothetical protein JJE03_00405 [Peptostreptococcaceae bacterium]|nr:hypothetical protein [Peptostreptococcaceae bacterium]